MRAAMQRTRVPATHMGHAAGTHAGRGQRLRAVYGRSAGEAGGYAGMPWPFCPFSSYPFVRAQEEHMIDGVQQQLTSFSPGFWFFDGKMFKLER